MRLRAATVQRSVQDLRLSVAISAAQRRELKTFCVRNRPKRPICLSTPTHPAATIRRDMAQRYYAGFAFTSPARELAQRTHA